MREKIKKISKLISKIFEFPNILLLLALIFFILYRRQFFSIISLNLGLIFLLLPFFLIFSWLLIKQRHNRDFLTIATILFIILVFLLQTFQADIEKITSINAANNYNCGILESIPDLEENLSSRFRLNYYITEPYRENTNFIYNKFGVQIGNIYMGTLFLMQNTNSLIRTVQELNIQGIDPSLTTNVTKAIGMYNKQIIKNSEIIKENICQKDFDIIPATLFKKLISKTKEWLRI